MAKYTGNSLIVTAGATDLTANLIKSVEITQSADTYESTGASDTAKTYLGGHQDGSVKIDAWDSTAASDFRNIFAIGTEFTGVTTSALHVRPRGKGSNPNLAFAAIVTGLTFGASHDGVTPVSVTLQMNSAVTETIAD